MDADVQWVATHMQGAGGAGGMEAVMARDCLMRFGGASEKLRSELVAWTEWMANGSPPWAAIRAVLANHLMALDKQPGTRPVGIGEVWRRSMAKLVIRKS
eukprot:11052432-Ditylum_brightwellii.AAC.1